MEVSLINEEIKTQSLKVQQNISDIGVGSNIQKMIDRLVGKKLIHFRPSK